MTGGVLTLPIIAATVRFVKSGQGDAVDLPEV